MSTVTSALSRNLRQYGIWGALILIIILFQIMTDGLLLKPNNVASLIQQNAYVMILAIGMVMVIVAGHIDLAVGSIIAFVGGATAIMMNFWGWPWPVAVLGALVLGAIIGAWQGFWVAYVGIPAFIVTLASMLLFRGLAIVIVGTTVAGLPAGFVSISNDSLPNFLGFAANLDVVTLVLGAVGIAGLLLSQLRARRGRIKHSLTVEPAGLFWGKNALISVLIAYITYLLARSAGGTPIVLVLIAVLILVYSFILNRTVFGREVYAIGGNLNAAILSGVNTRLTNFLIFVNMGFLTAVAAIVVTSRAGAAVASAGQSYELDAIAACFIGGTAVTGGIGRISGAIVGALVMGVLNMGLSIMAVDAAWQQAIKGLVLLAAVALDLLAKRRSGR